MSSDGNPGDSVGTQRKHAHTHPRRAARFFIVTVSDTRTFETDESGKRAEDLIEAAGHTVVLRKILPDEPALIASEVSAVSAERTAEVILTLGGTGISVRDTTYEAVSGLLSKRLDGFGELFRMLSWDQVGAAAMLSRAVAGLVGETWVFALPGSKNATELALTKLILPEISHLLGERRKHVAKTDLLNG